jgi:hypothetical protein
MQKVLESGDVRDTALKSIAKHVGGAIAENAHVFDRVEDRPWVLRDGGEYFVCANSGCEVHRKPMNADHNAAAVVGLRFLRGVDGIRVTISGNGTVTRSIGYVPPNLRLEQDNSGMDSSWSAHTGNKGSTRGRTPNPEEDGTSNDDEEAGGARTLFRDPSGKFRCANRWFERKTFWGLVARSCAAGVKAANASRFGAECDEAEG